MSIRSHPQAHAEARDSLASTRRRPAARLLCSMALGVMALPAMAQSTSGAEGLLNNSWVFNLGGFVYNTDVKANLNGQSTNNPEIDFNETFGKADDATRVRADVLWRITPSHHLRFMYFDNSVTRSNVLEEDLKWGDYTFSAQSRTDFKQKFKAINLAYEYAFMRSPTYELAGSAGVHVLDFDVQLSGEATVTDANGVVSQPRFESTRNTLSAPLPMLGLRAGWVVSPSWYLDAQAQLFKIKVGDYDGNWSDLRLGATWMFHRNYGVGLAYNRFNTRLDVEGTDFDGRVRLNYQGFVAFLTGTF